MLRNVWYRFLEIHSEEFFMDSVRMANEDFLVDFRTAVYDKNSENLRSVAPFQLLVYRDMAAYSDRNAPQAEGPLDPTIKIGMLGTLESMLVVTIRLLNCTVRSDALLILSRRGADAVRIQRWIQLNEVLAGHPRKSEAKDSLGYSYVTWNQVKAIFEPANYDQPRKALDDSVIDFLAKYLSYTTKVFGGHVSSGKEAKRLHFIAPVLISVCFQLQDVEMVAEEDLTGKFIKAHGHFEFMLKRGKRAVCIVEAKKDDVEQGMAQDLIGCEVAAEVGELDVVYGIVTNYLQWFFLCSRNDKVQKQECTLRLTPNGPDRASLREIAEKIYAMLS